MKYMKLFRILSVFLGLMAALTGAAASSLAECSKSVAFAVTNGGQPVEAVPSFAAHWIVEAKHQQRYPGLCFAQSPDPRTKNYVVIFSAQPESFDGLVPAVLKYVNSAPVPEDTTIRAVYGEMWHYSTTRPADENTTTFNLLHLDSSATLFVRAYNEQGTVVSQVSLKEISAWLHIKDKLLERVLNDIHADARPLLDPSQAAVKTSLPVYYVNCDVPIKSLTSGPLAATGKPASPPTPAPTPPQLATLGFWSNPAGAEVYVDGKLVGTTPSSFSLPPGEYTITMRKQNYGTWERKVQLAAGERKIVGYLDQKVVILGSGQP